MYPVLMSHERVVESLQRLGLSVQDKDERALVNLEGFRISVETQFLPPILIVRGATNAVALTERFRVTNHLTKWNQQPHLAGLFHQTVTVTKEALDGNKPGPGIKVGKEAFQIYSSATQFTPAGAYDDQLDMWLKAMLTDVLEGLRSVHREFDLPLIEDVAELKDGRWVEKA